MATRLATQRNFVTITPANANNETNNKHNSTSTTPEDVITITPAESADQNTSQNDSIQISHIMSQKKIILQTGSSGVSVIDVVPIDVSDSSDESPVTVNTISAGVKSGAGGVSEARDDATSGTQQQVTAQVAVVESQSPGDSSAGPHYITVTVASQDNPSGHDTYQVQYVDPEIYNANSQNQAQISYPFCAVSDYPPNTQPYYATTGNYTAATNTPSHSSSLPYIVPVDDNLLVPSSQSRDSPQSLTATPTSTTTSNTESDSTPNLSHATRISPATVAWLMENYETAEGVSLPRSTLYNHYMRHCNENKLDAVNAASFGKLIRSVFNGLRTRRLGTRGNSKYHYYGIRIKPGSSLMHAIEEKPQNINSAPSNGPNTGNSKNMKKIGAKPETFEACLQYLGVGTAAIPVFPSINIDQSLPEDITLDDIDAFRSIYREHCELFLDAILNLEFSSVESLWRDFWRASDNNNLDESEEEKYLTKSKLYALCQSDSVQNFIKEVDYNFYQNMVDVLIPDVLRPIPSSLTQAIRNFAKNLENWLTDAMSGCPQKVTQIKIAAVSAFSQTLRRYTSLNHLAQAARAVLQNSSQIAQMLNDLNRVDFNNVQEQASWVCQCDTATVQRLENDFKTALQRQNTLEQWAAWLRLVVDSALEEYRGKPTYAKAARQFLLKWSFYSSMVIRDLTLRSAASFGSFHLIRLLYDEYMFFLVEHKVAQARHTTPIAVMTEVDKVDSQSNLEFVYPMEFNIKPEPSGKRMKN
ncbi:DNA-binding protein RFX2 isoform X3 [Hermetia illucens]|uniref:DNA-binding protein RFX2 isoform X3 n=1 Tax=Hermetia illucens TaxID=343691 RepID=UPI0018CC0834|nr:DNA-binding protein RFX2 isoform X3 [Hermetia illucens]